MWYTRDIEHEILCGAPHHHKEVFMNEHFKCLAHIGVMTNDLEKSIAFYALLGGKVADTAVLPTPQGEKKLVMVEVCGIVVELIVPPAPVELCEGVVSHFAVYVDDMDATAAKLKAAGIDSFATPEKNVSSLFGGMVNWFLTGPNGERIELIEWKA